MTFMALAFWTIAQAAPVPPEGLTGKNWRAHPRVVAVRSAVHEIDAMTGTATTSRRCHTPRDDGEGRVTVESIEETTTRMNDANASTKTSALHRVRNTGHAHVDAEGDLQVVFYTRNGVPLFLYVTGAYRGERFFHPEVRVYFDAEGKPFWSVVVTARDEGAEVQAGFADESRGSVAYHEIVPLLERWRTATARDVFSACSADTNALLRTER